MGRRKIMIKKIEDSTTLQITYTKRRDGIVKKANELSVLCGADVGLLMFSPSGRLTRFSTSERIEDMFLRYLDQYDEFEGPIENEERLYRGLKRSRCEGKMLEMIAKKEALERKLHELNQRQDEAEEKLRFYQPKVEEITTIREAYVCQQYLTDVIRRVEKLKEKLLSKESESRSPETVVTMDTNLSTEESMRSKRKRYENHHEESSLSTASHPSMEFPTTLDS